jgi:phosphatidylserine/phosphatidylglycerophosphate/cardiolipin synthase-like enzyme
MVAFASRFTKPTLTVRTLTDGGQSAADVAAWIAEFLDGARKTLDVAQYDFHLGGDARDIVSDAFHRAAGRGVRTRLVYNVDHRNPIPVPPPPEPDVAFIATLPVQGKAIAGVPDLMHHKFVVRDGKSVWSGSMNWTDESFTCQENVVVRVDGRAVASAFAKDFEQLWARDSVERTGFVAPVWHAGVRPWFTPGHGEDLSHRIAKQIGRAQRRVRICSPVITTAPVLATLAQIVSEGGVDLAGCVDVTQMRGVVHQWRLNGNVSWKLPLLERVLAGPFSGKVSTPWRAEGSLHDFMHAKVTVADDTVFVGSFNLSRSGEANAENVLEIEDAALADQLAGFVDRVRVLYPAVDVSGA